MRLLCSTLTLVGLVSVGGIAAPAIQMDVQGQETRCLSDSVRAGGDTTFNYRAVPIDGTSTESIKVSVVHPNGEIHNADLKETAEGHLVEKSEGGGTYKVCFQNLQSKGASTRVELVETTIFEELGPRPDTPVHLRPVDVLLHHAQEVSKSLKQQLEESALMESERNEDDKLLRYRINNLAGFTIIVLLSVSGWQLALLNKFFRSKKLI